MSFIVYTTPLIEEIYQLSDFQTILKKQKYFQTNIVKIN